MQDLFEQLPFAAAFLKIAIVLLLIVVAALLALRLTNRLAAEASRRMITADMPNERRARLHTLISTSKNTVNALVLSIAVLSGLTTLGINIGPVLAAAGIAGLAITLGAQSLIKDYIGGLLILVEDQFRVGDWIKAATIEGQVEQITLRRTNLRGSDGTLYVVPNGDIRVVGNTTYGWSRALVELNLAFEADVAKAVAALEAAMAKAAADPAIKADLIDAPEILGWNQLSDWAICVRVQAKVKTGRQGPVARVLRRYALDGLHQAGVPLERNWPQVGAA
jgi:moderate conductance mechanosensitive channel